MAKSQQTTEHFMQTLETCLWFNGQAEAAAAFYVSVFKQAKLLGTTRYPEGLPQPAGSVLTVRFSLDGMVFTALNGGPQYTFTPAISMVVTCDTQEEVDDYWQKLTAGGEEQPCGWLRDRFGVSWQVVPKGLMDLLGGPDKAGTQRAVQAMLGMTKLDLATLRRAYDRA
jgi:predicted 3-demethylubiquinone-9 3-methyltransferase (glyoxalase superfamily)